MDVRKISIGLGISLLLGANAPGWAEVADDLVCDHCVDQYDLEFGAVKTGHIKNRSVTQQKLADGVVDWRRLAESLQQRILDLEARIAQLESSSVQALEGFVSMDTSNPSRPTVIFAGVNLQVVNGAGAESMEPNGLGNVIVGYDQPFIPRDGDTEVCSMGAYRTLEECEAAGHVWAMQHKSGSHNLVIGQGHRYSWLHSIVTGTNNTINNNGGGVIGARYSTAQGRSAVVLGGSSHRASGNNAAVLGGWDNEASGPASMVSGGVHNSATQQGATVTGGNFGLASGYNSTVSGGSYNTASGPQSSVSGGWSNISEGKAASVNGGYLNTALGEYSVVSGGYVNTASGIYSTLGGGQERTVPGESDWAAGSLWEDQ